MPIGNRHGFYFWVRPSLAHFLYGVVFGEKVLKLVDSRTLQQKSCQLQRVIEQLRSLAILFLLFDETEFVKFWDKVNQKVNVKLVSMTRYFHVNEAFQ